jgi:hydrogenase nickel incorporation protein HypB
MFQKSDALVITKTDTAPYFRFDFEKCKERAKKLNPGIRIFTLSAKTGEGMKEWEDWLKEETAAWKK